MQRIILTDASAVPKSRGEREDEATRKSNRLTGGVPAWPGYWKIGLFLIFNTAAWSLLVLAARAIFL